MLALLSSSLAFLLALGSTSGFSPSVSVGLSRTSIGAKNGFCQPEDGSVDLVTTQGQCERRQFLNGGLLVGGLIGLPNMVVAGVDVSEKKPDKGPSTSMSKDKRTVGSTQAVLVLGANGQTGQECVRAVLESGRPCIASSRQGTFAASEEAWSQEAIKQGSFSTVALDVTQPDQLDESISGIPNLGAVIFAASASTKGGNAYQVDRDGVTYAAKACIKHNVRRYVVVSSGTVTRPDSAVYQLLNTVGKGIMEAKIQGEDAIRSLYSDSKVLEQNIGYTVVRPGGLTNAPPLGAAEMELNQGDSKSGRLSRADVAGICVQALASPDTWDTTFECYERLTAKPVESVGLSNILKLKGESTFISGKERQGETWPNLFNGLSTDPGHELTV